MNKITKGKIQKIIHIGIIIVASFFVGLSLQLVHAWTEPTLTAPNGNLGAPINTGATAQTKTGVLYINGGIVTPLIWDLNNAGYYLDPNGSSQISTIYANNWFRAQGDSGFYFQDHGSGFNMTDNTWIRAYGAGNIYAPGEMQATNIRANGLLCIGSDCRNSWPATVNSINWNTWQYGNYYQTDGNIYMGWAGNWLSNVLGSKLQLDTWQGGHYFASSGDEYFNGGKGRMFYQSNEGETLQLTGNNGQNVFLENINGTFRLVNNPWSADIFHVDQSGNMSIPGYAYASGLCINGDCRPHWQYFETKESSVINAPQNTSCYYPYRTLVVTPAVYCSPGCTMTGCEISVRCASGDCQGNYNWSPFYKDYRTYGIGQNNPYCYAAYGTLADSDANSCSVTAEYTYLYANWQVKGRVKCLCP